MIALVGMACLTFNWLGFLVILVSSLTAYSVRILENSAARWRKNTGWKPMLTLFSGLSSDLSEPSRGLSPCTRSSDATAQCGIGFQPVSCSDCWATLSDAGRPDSDGAPELRPISARFLLVAPVSFNPVPPTVMLNPVSWNPVCVMMRIMNVVARYPDVAPSVPSPVARIPNVIRAGRWRCRLNPDRGRSGPHNDLLCPGVRRNGQCASGKQQCTENSDQMRFRMTLRLPLHIGMNRSGIRRLRRIPEHPCLRVAD
jgi:hypothetical protein